MFPEGNEQSSERARIESLRLILEREQRRLVTYEEALEVGESLICFYEALAEDSTPDKELLLREAH